VHSPRSLKGTAAVVWALLGVALLFSSAVYRLGYRGVETLRGGLGPLEWVALVSLTLVFLYGEGVRALQRRWVPRMIQRVRLLHGEVGVHYRVLAPFYAMSLVGGPGARLLRAWGSTGAIIVAVLVVRGFPEPWRGITDLAVASALAWGLAAMVRGVPEALRRGEGTGAP